MNWYNKHLATIYYQRQQIQISKDLVQKNDVNVAETHVILVSCFDQLTVFPHIIAAATILFLNSSSEETIQVFIT